MIWDFERPGPAKGDVVIAGSGMGMGRGVCRGEFLSVMGWADDVASSVARSIIWSNSMMEAEM
jgi:hypothetical protein